MLPVPQQRHGQHGRPVLWSGGRMVNHVDQASLPGRRDAGEDSRLAVPVSQSIPPKSLNACPACWDYKDRDGPIEQGNPTPNPL
ncbi:hypothetical protein NHX12_016312 [Muraenolepis orangiensis]|uniref:Uncharacterized protein n=1 Tax=Muraenolepis orangiensis TaxID=630683 RepID=A0A9Q0D9J2_9TELE|nr:hypothetical protein NHX12_016312 [Muraenolepis orangiensis]